MQYLSLRETIRRLRSAGVDVDQRAVRTWIRQRKIRDVLVLGEHVFIYEEEIQGLVAAAPTRL